MISSLLLLIFTGMQNVLCRWYNGLTPQTEAPMAEPTQDIYPTFAHDSCDGCGARPLDPAREPSRNPMLE